MIKLKMIFIWKKEEKLKEVKEELFMIKYIVFQVDLLKFIVQCFISKIYSNLL